MKTRQSNYKIHKTTKLRKRTYKTVPDHSIPDEIGCTSAAYDRRVILNGDLGGLPHSGSYVFGSTMLSIPESLIVDEAVDLSTNDASSITVLEESNNRGIEHWTGTYKVLVVRVTTRMVYRLPLQPLSSQRESLLRQEPPW